MLFGKAGIAQIDNFEKQSIVQINLDVFPNENAHIDAVLDVFELLLVLLLDLLFLGYRGFQKSYF